MRLTALDGWRGVLSLMVVLAHFPGNVVLQDTSFYYSGSAIIDIFFLFSGFVIVAHYEPKLASGYGVKRFLIERLGRIYPIHFVMLMLFVLFELVLVYFGNRAGLVERQAFSGGNTIPSLFTNLLLIQSLDIHDMLTWNYPTWSLSTEWTAYILFALCMLAPIKRFLPFAIVGVIASPILLAILSEHPMLENYRYGLLRSTYGFAGGALIFYVFYWIKTKKLDERVPMVVWNVLEILATIATFALPAVLGYSRISVIIPAGYMVCLLIFALQKGVVSRIMSHPALVHLGVISLSIYVVHAFVLLRLVNVAEALQKITHLPLIDSQMFHGAMTKIIVLGPVGNNLLAVFSVMVIVFISHFSYKYIELPADKKVRQWTKARAAARAEEKPVPVQVTV
ncbi:MAG TPA: acyltransferase [Ensifer sp.]|nr:acyltransferase [Ensifer sp.]